MSILKQTIKEKVLAVVEANQPVTAGKVAALLKSQFGLEITTEEISVYLSKMRTDFSKRIARSANRYSVVDLGGEFQGG